MAILGGALRLFGNIVLAVMISSSICTTLRVKKGEKLSKKRAAIASFLILIALVLAGLSFEASTAFNNFDKNIKETELTIKKDILNKLNQNNKIERKSKLSQLYAKMTYEEEGKIIEYLTPEGKSAAYIPTPDAEKNRDMLLFLITYRKMFAPVNITIGLIWLISIIAAIGFVVHRRRSTATTEPGSSA